VCVFATFLHFSRLGAPHSTLVAESYHAFWFICSLLYHPAACKQNFAAISSLSEIASSAISVIQVTYRILSDWCVFVCCGLIKLHYWELTRGCVYACTAQIKLEIISVRTARCYLLLNHGSSSPGCYYCFTLKR